MSELKGLIASRGYAYGQAFVYREGAMTLKRAKLDKGQCEEEKHRLRTQIQELKNKAERIFDASTLAIFESYELLLDDTEFVAAIEDRMETEDVGAAWAIHEVMAQHAERVEQLNSEYLRERATDIRDLEQRLIKDFLGQAPENIPDLTNRILVAEDLSPAQSMQWNLQALQGLIIDRGGVTSHTSILARALNIPAIVGARDATRLIHDDDWILMDAVSNRVWINPDASLVGLYEASRASFHLEQQELLALVNQPTRMRDGRVITLAANIGGPTELSAALAAGAEGIGLFRTEFLFMNRTDLPLEEEQYALYRSVLEAMQPHPVIIRTMDVGGDKDLPHLQLEREDNPFLGCRGIRVSLRRPELFRTQLRALLRASQHGDLKIMFPMVAAVEELIEIRRMVQEVEQDLALPHKVELGIMIETPASAMLAEHMIRFVDFFSIGTNDLTQYTLAVDRGNLEIRDLYQPLSPAVLQMMDRAMQAATRAGKWVGVCGELAGDPLGALLLVGMGATELSMSAGSIGRVKKYLLQSDGKESREWVDKVLRCATVAEVKALLEAWEAELHS
jgi:phosphotransferase system enzyme I (PtsI)